MSPRMESDPGTELRRVWIYLTPEEAEDLRLALECRASEPDDPEWHTHLTDPTGGNSQWPLEMTSRSGWQIAPCPRLHLRARPGRRSHLEGQSTLRHSLTS